MFEELRNAWQEAVANFYRELGGAAEGDGSRIDAMERDQAAAAASHRRVEAERDRARGELRREREELAACRRRAEMARGIGDDETVEVAERFAAKHAERVEVLSRVVEALDAESALRRRDLEEMRGALAAARASVGAGEETDELGASADGPSGVGAAAGGDRDRAEDRNAGTAPGGRAGGSLFDDERDALFRRMEREARERDAERRLEELKRKIR